MSESRSSGGIGFTGLLTLLLIALKLTHYIDWSWWWVLLPLWISFALGMVALTAAVVFGLLAQVCGRNRTPSG